MLISFPAFLTYRFLMGSARAQVNAPTCTNDTFGWSFNSLQQSPCWVTACLAAVCNNGTFFFPALLPNNSYTGPSGIDDDDLCKCNTVVYNLISACDACQGASWITYSTWSFNCTTKAPPGTFPEPVPAGTRVPLWAYIDTSIGDSWNISAAKLVGDYPEITGTTAIIPTSTSKAAQTVTSSTSLFSTSTVGAIAGGIVSGILGVALLSGVVAWFVVRRRRARSAISSIFSSDQEGELEQPASYPLLTIETPTTLYDPSDPVTCPSNEHLLVDNRCLGSTSHLRSKDAGYKGLPEI